MNSRNKTKAILIVLSILIILSVALFLSKSAAVKCPRATKTEKKEAAIGNFKFALDLYAKLREKEGNIVFSPLSISTALAMTYAGARTETESQMKETLHFTLGQEKLHPAMASIIKDINKRGGAGKFELIVANRLWGQKGNSFLESFLGINQKCYGSNWGLVNFKESPENARKEINDWIEKQTRGKIKEPIKKGMLTPLDTLVITNAVYFKSRWKNVFHKLNTSPMDFYISPEKKIIVDMMYQEQNFKVSRGHKCSILEMPYVTEELAMSILLPDELGGLEEVENQLSYENLKNWTGSGNIEWMDVLIPRFKTNFWIDLNKTLSAMGMKDAFNETADFSGIDGRYDTFISHVIHQAYIDVNEAGTEAAATVSGMATSGVNPVFKADHPFLYLIIDKKTDSILFMGRVVDPSA